MPSERRTFPYYKVQTFDERSMTWRERKVGFDDLDSARECIASLETRVRWRIVRFDESGHQDIEAGP